MILPSGHIKKPNGPEGPKSSHILGGFPRFFQALLREGKREKELRARACFLRLQNAEVSIKPIKNGSVMTASSSLASVLPLFHQSVGIRTRETRFKRTVVVYFTSSLPFVCCASISFLSYCLISWMFLDDVISGSKWNNEGRIARGDFSLGDQIESSPKKPFFTSSCSYFCPSLFGRCGSLRKSPYKNWETLKRWISQIIARDAIAVLSFDPLNFWENPISDIGQNIAGGLELEIGSGVPLLLSQPRNGINLHLYEKKRLLVTSTLTTRRLPEQRFKFFAGIYALQPTTKIPGAPKSATSKSHPRSRGSLASSGTLQHQSDPVEQSKKIRQSIVRNKAFIEIWWCSCGPCSCTVRSFAHKCVRFDRDPNNAILMIICVKISSSEHEPQNFWRENITRYVRFPTSTSTYDGAKVIWRSVFKIS